MSEPKDVLARFHRTLVEEITQKRPEYLQGPFSVAEIYQDLVPYGSHRDRLGVEMNGDYEDALVRILAGEGGFLLLESEPALKALRKELESSNPNTGVYREYAAVDVRLNPDNLPAQDDFELGPESNGEVDAGQLSVEPMEDLVPVGDLAPAPAPAELSEAGSESAGATCHWCRAELPDRANVNFCPFCGTDTHLVPCASCGEEIEPGWRFCASCGAEVGA